MGDFEGIYKYLGWICAILVDYMVIYGDIVAIYRDLVWFSLILGVLCDFGGI